MKMEKRWLWSELGSPWSPDTSEIYRQNNAKPQEVEKEREENRTTGWKTPHHGRGAHHGLAVVAAVVVFRYFGSSSWAAGFAFPWGILGLFASFFWSS